MAKTAKARNGGQSTSSMSYAERQNAVKEALKCHGLASSTLKTYDGHIKRANTWMENWTKEQAAAERRDALSPPPMDDEEPDDDLDEEMNGVEGAQMDPGFQNAFEGNPTESTPTAITMYLHYKCYEQENGKATADQIHASFRDHYNKLEGDKYRGTWRWDFHLEEWVGNPVSCAQVEDMMDSCKNKDGEAERTHSRAMSMDDMKRLYDYCQKQLSTISVPQPNGQYSREQLEKMGPFLMFMAFAAVGFTLWTRNCETTNLKYKHFLFAQKRRQGSPENPVGAQWFEANLRNRKNWQKRVKAGETQLNGHRYRIWPQQTAAVDMYSRLLDWLDFLEIYLLQRPLKDDDHIFPSIGANGLLVHPDRAITPGRISKLITKMSKDAGIRGAERFTTHCFRRGGAQYRFMYAPVGERWTLARIRWWGGWAKGEHRDTLIKYLLDELYTYEEDHSNALCPFEEGNSLSHNGEANERQPMSAAETRLLFCQQAEVYRTQLQYGLQALANSTVQQFGAYKGFTHQPPVPLQSVPLPHTHHGVIQQIVGSVPTEVVQLSAPVSLHHHDRRQANVGFIPLNPSQLPPQPTPQANDAAHIIPEVPRSLRGRAWKQVVDDWLQADPRRNHMVPLRDWQTDWHKSSGQSQKYGQRRLIAEEYLDQFRRDDDAFRAAYPEYAKGLSPLIRAIRSARQQRGTCTQRLRS